MPAFRSRTQRWRDLLDQIMLRGGAIEIALAGDDDPSGCGAGVGASEGVSVAGASGPRLVRASDEAVRESASASARGASAIGGAGRGAPDLVWRVRLHAVQGDALVVEMPAVLGRAVPIEAGVRLHAAMTVGQNRWRFDTRCLGQIAARGGPIGETPGLRLALPERVERCTRRVEDRVSAGGLLLPRVRCWAIEGPSVALAAEAANRLAITAREEGGCGVASAGLQEFLRDGLHGQGDGLDESSLLPALGPAFDARVQNLSAGGMGLLVSGADAGAAQRARFLWVRMDLRPGLPVPLAVTARVAHAHMDSRQNLAVGLAWDFRHHVEHQAFVARLLRDYVRSLQQRAAAGGEQHARRVA